MSCNSGFLPRQIRARARFTVIKHGSRSFSAFPTTAHMSESAQAFVYSYLHPSVHEHLRAKRWLSRGKKTIALPWGNTGILRQIPKERRLAGQSREIFSLSYTVKCLPNTRLTILLHSRVCRQTEYQTTIDKCSLRALDRRSCKRECVYRRLRKIFNISPV